jgi:hypothetical protein
VRAADQVPRRMLEIEAFGHAPSVAAHPRDSSACRTGN